MYTHRYARTLWIFVSNLSLCHCSITTGCKDNKKRVEIQIFKDFFINTSHLFSYMPGLWTADDGSFPY